MRQGGRIALLVALWLLAWGDLSVANVVSGLAVAAALLVAFPLARRRVGSRANARGILRLLGAVAVQLVVSNIVMTREILRRRPNPRPGVVVHRLQQPSEVVVTVMSSVISLSPGTMTVDVAADSSEIAVHFYDLPDPVRAHAELRRLERLAAGAIGARRRGRDGHDHPHPAPKEAP